MPLYDYKCENGHVFEEVQSWTSDPVATCGDCGTSATRMLSVPMVLYKGSGFYTTDYGRNGSASRSKSDSDGESSTSGSKAKEKSKSKSSSSDSSD
ncbi:MAG: zinc ribbon domain-containing protein [Chloroflexi bacterium]|nr:zinc ribbon domain-containing protein [Chloroflexota bacterium]MYK62411.1 zinc ribbon domain-containing protein [Chloroflexota bacterium]